MKIIVIVMTVKSKLSMMHYQLGAVLQTHIIKNNKIIRYYELHFNSELVPCYRCDI